MHEILRHIRLISAQPLGRIALIGLAIIMLLGVGVMVYNGVSSLGQSVAQNLPSRGNTPSPSPAQAHATGSTGCSGIPQRLVPRVGHKPPVPCNSTSFAGYDPQTGASLLDRQVVVYVGDTQMGRFVSKVGLDGSFRRSRIVPFFVDIEEATIRISYNSSGGFGGGGFNGYNIDFIGMNSATPCYAIKSAEIDPTRTQMRGVRAWSERNRVKINVSGLRYSPSSDIIVNVNLERC